MYYKEFAEISPGGGIMEFIISQDGNGISFGFRSGPKGQIRAIHALRVNIDGRILGNQLLGGVNRQERPPDFEFPVFMFSDMEGMFGRTCPQCKSYFRTSSAGDLLFCPYCGIRDVLGCFLTDNQVLFVEKVVHMTREALYKKESSELDIDLIINELPDNRPPWLNIEKKLQNTFKCPECENEYDILGEYGSCPQCRKENALDLLRTKMETINSDVLDNITSGKFDENDIPCNQMTQLISEFEAMSKFIQRRLALLPMTPKRRKEFDKLSFQRFKDSSKSLMDWFGIHLCRSLSSEDTKFMHIMFDRRHLFIHNNGQVDKKYLKDSNDSTVKLNQRLKVNRKEFILLYDLLIKCGENLVNEYNSLN